MVTEIDIIECRACNGKGLQSIQKSVNSYMNVYSYEEVPCTGCNGTGLLRVADLKPAESTC